LADLAKQMAASATGWTSQQLGGSEGIARLALG